MVGGKEGEVVGGIVPGHIVVILMTWFSNSVRALLKHIP